MTTRSPATNGTPVGTPEDIARALRFFAAAWITGQTISVDGGRWMLG